MAARTLCTSHARRTQAGWAVTLPPAAQRTVRRPPPARPGPAAWQAPPRSPGRPAGRPARKRPRRRPVAALARLALLAGCGCLFAAALRFMAGSLSPSAPAGPGEAAPAPLPLEVQPVLQNPELPNGCEAASLACLLQYEGFPVTATELAREWLPCEGFSYSGPDRLGPDPEAAYAGDPFSSKNGWYCFEGPVLEAANGYLRAAGSPLTARRLTGAGPEELLAQLQAGRPVAVWFTQDHQPPRYSSGFSWRLPGGGRYTPYANLHCVVLTGISDALCTLADPLQGTTQVDRALFFEIYTAMGSRAAALS